MCYLLTYCAPCYSVSIVNFEQLNDGWLIAEVVAPKRTNSFRLTDLFHNSDAYVFFKPDSLSEHHKVVKKLLSQFLINSNNIPHRQNYEISQRN